MTFGLCLKAYYIGKNKHVFLMDQKDLKSIGVLKSSFNSKV